MKRSSLRQIATPQHRSRPRGNDRPCLKTRPSGQHPRRRFLALTAGAAALPAVSRIVWAQTYPSRPITIVVGFAAGGSTDTIGRMIAERMKSSLGQPVIVEDVTGAGGTIAVGRVARAGPDGYTLSLGNNSSHVVAGATFALQYDLLNDFEPVALLSTGPFVVVAKKTMPANDLKGLIAWLKANMMTLTLRGPEERSVSMTRRSSFDRCTSLASPRMIHRQVSRSNCAAFSMVSTGRGLGYAITDQTAPRRPWWQRLVG
jgi:Tripartite tricarboxylate transporter family receptor